MNTIAVRPKTTAQITQKPRNKPQLPPEEKQRRKKIKAAWWDLWEGYSSVSQEAWEIASQFVGTPEFLYCKESHLGGVGTHNKWGLRMNRYAFSFVNPILKSMQEDKVMKRNFNDDYDLGMDLFGYFQTALAFAIDQSACEIYTNPHNGQVEPKIERWIVYFAILETWRREHGYYRMKSEGVNLKGYPQSNEGEVIEPHEDSLKERKNFFAWVKENVPNWQTIVMKHVTDVMPKVHPNVQTGLGLQYLRLSLDGESYKEIARIFKKVRADGTPRNDYVRKSIRGLVKEVLPLVRYTSSVARNGNAVTKEDMKHGVAYWEEELEHLLKNSDDFVAILDAEKNLFDAMELLGEREYHESLLSFDDTNPQRFSRADDPTAWLVDRRLGRNWTPLPTCNERIPFTPEPITAKNPADCVGSAMPKAGWKEDLIKSLPGYWEPRRNELYENN